MTGKIPREFSLKKTVLSGIGLFASLMMLLALCYFLIVGEEGVYIYGHYIGSKTATECGFTMLKFSSDLITSSYQWGAIVIGLFCLLQLVLSLALIIANILTFLLAPKKINTVVTMVSSVGNAFFSFLYMLEGIIFTTICNDTLSGNFITFAYIPFIFAILIVAAYFVCFGVIKEKDGGQPADGMPYSTYGAYQYDPITGQPIAPQANPMYGAYGFDPMTGQPIAQSADETGAEGEGDQDRLSPEKANMLLMNFRNCIPEERIPAFRYALGKAKASCYTSLSMVPLKNPTTVLLFSIFLGGWGVDRFYIGDTGMGVAKLLAGWLTLGIWPFVDIFLCYKKVKEQNFALLMGALQNAAY